MNWLAIGILALLALSMMISSKPFRVFIGTAAVVIVTVVAVLAFWGMRTLPAFDWKFQITRRPNLQQAAEDMSAQVLADIDRAVADTDDSQDAESVPGSLEDPFIMSSTEPNGSDGTSLNPDASNMPTLIGQHIELKPPIGNMSQEVTLKVKMANVVSEYLKKYHNSSTEPGVADLKPENLNWRLLKYIYKGTDEKGVKHVTLVFDDKFHDHVREHSASETFILDGTRRSTLLKIAGIVNLFTPAL